MEPERKRDWNFTKDRKIHGESNVWSADQRQKKIYGFDVHFLFVRNVDQLAMTNNVCWYGHVLRREDGHVLRREFGFEIEGQGNKRRPKRTWI